MLYTDGTTLIAYPIQYSFADCRLFFFFLYNYCETPNYNIIREIRRWRARDEKTRNGVIVITCIMLRRRVGDDDGRPLQPLRPRLAYRTARYIIDFALSAAAAAATHDRRRLCTGGGVFRHGRLFAPAVSSSASPARDTGAEPHVPCVNTGGETRETRAGADFWRV